MYNSELFEVADGRQGSLCYTIRGVDLYIIPLCSLQYLAQCPRVQISLTSRSPNVTEPKFILLATGEANKTAVELLKHKVTTLLEKLSN